VLFVQYAVNGILVVILSRGGKNNQTIMLINNRHKKILNTSLYLIRYLVRSIFNCNLILEDIIKWSYTWHVNVMLIVDPIFSGK
jgi:hypothetical protein